ncbi:hypothetical protein AAC03nite_23140 [Alicyclobacillus acidoterrestris]|uniref:sensor histidine kinase n=1 Tax=Alicyclobacillus suci TaxID=2816080 RepID=UPI00119188AD|nr:sensor histidine kinase [Alicyclobacillus suci]GEO26529.1 hypothetical protein AAC03nite_23140 [Alicyclobacillus acidoterrestris]
MIPRYIKWALFFVPALVIGGFETVRHTLLTNILPMEMGNWVTAVIDAVVIAIVSRTLFQRFARTEQALSQERESRAVMEERERLARTLHDHIAQSLFYAGVQIQAVKSRTSASADPTLQSELDDISQSLREMDENVRQAIFNLKQKSVVGGAFEDRVRSYLDQTLSPTRIRWTMEASSPLPALLTTEQVQLFGILQEAITNVMKHARASHVRVRLEADERDATRWQFTIEDDGVGFDWQNVSQQAPGARRYGMEMMATRARDMGAEFLVQSSVEGTVITIQSPSFAKSRAHSTT